MTPFVSNQVHYSLQTRDIENEIVPLVIDQGVGILVRSPIVGGLLSGKYRRGVEAPPGSRHLSEWNEPPVYDQDRLYDIVDELVAKVRSLRPATAMPAGCWWRPPGPPHRSGPAGRWSTAPLPPRLRKGLESG